MKKIFFILILLSFLSTAFSQECYTVMKVKGEILKESTGKKLEVNDRLCPDEKVIFKSKDAAAMLYSPSTGKYTIKPDKKSKKEISGIISAHVSSVLSTVQKQTYTKSDPFEKGFDFSALEKTDNELYIIGQYEMYVFSEFFTAETQVYAKYGYNGTEYTVNLKNTGRGYLLDEEAVYAVNDVKDQYLVDEVLILYGDREGGKFTLRFPDTEVLKSELSAYIDELRSKELTDSEIFGEAEDYFRAIYGNFEQGNFNQFMLDNFSMEKEIY